MDVVDLDDALVEKIVAQSDAQNEGLSVQLEWIRDENLVGILHALRDNDGGRGWGADGCSRISKRDCTPPRPGRLRRDRRATTFGSHRPGWTTTGT